jgi:hypothetical protein
MRKPFLILATVAAIIASSGARAEMSLNGKWEIVDAAAAPWVAQDNRAGVTARGQKLVNQVVTFSPKEIVAPQKAFVCKRAMYKASDYPLDALFLGALPEPNQERVALNMGFPKGEVMSVDVRCQKGMFAFHFRDKDTALFAHNNVIYTIKRR